VGVTERREREREEVRRKILTAAHDLFATEGYERVTMRRIADVIEYSPTTIYNHFEDKDDLVYALCQENFSRLFEHLQQAPPPSDPVQAIRQLGLAYAAFGTTYPNHYRFMFMTPAKFERPDGRVSPGEQAFGLVRTAVEAAVASGDFRPVDVDTAAQVLWSSIHGAVALIITIGPEQWPHAPAAPDLVEQVIEASVRGLSAGPRPTPPLRGKR
jgi:AcrR family transcriptional regulator